MEGGLIPKHVEAECSQMKKPAGTYMTCPVAPAPTGNARNEEEEEFAYEFLQGRRDHRCPRELCTRLVFNIPPMRSVSTLREEGVGRREQRGGRDNEKEEGSLVIIDRGGRGQTPKGWT